MKKIVSIILALTMVMALAVPAFAADEYTAFIMFATSSWYPSAMEAADHNSVTITGDGTYTIETDQLAGSSDALVFCIDIVDILADHPDVSAVLDSIEVDGKAVEFNADAVLYGDIEVDNDNYRIEIRNEYGETKDTVLKGYAFSIGTTLKVTFTVSGLGGGEASDGADETAADGAAADSNTAEPNTTAPSGENTASTPDTTSPDTGIALAVIPTVMALAVVGVFKKR